jgi:hypothetical protein
LKEYQSRLSQLYMYKGDFDNALKHTLMMRESETKPSAKRATSFIRASVFERWRKAHPDWRVIENAENKTKSARIEVPEIKFGGYLTGAV